MKTAKEYDEMFYGKKFILFEDIVKVIQNDAYNQAIYDAANTMNNQETLKLPRQTILKLIK